MELAYAQGGIRVDSQHEILVSNAVYGRVDFVFAHTRVYESGLSRLALRRAVPRCERC
jgi:hypothetical protein